MNSLYPILVTTKHRGVFFGYVDRNVHPELPRDTTLELKRCRNCVYWDSSRRGFIGLATNGPGAQCRVGPAADTMVLHDVTSVAAVSESAAEKWESAPWS